MSNNAVVSDNSGIAYFEAGVSKVFQLRIYFGHGSFDERRMR